MIKGRWVSGLRPDKLSVIAEASVASAEARAVLYRKPPARPAPSEKSQTVVLPWQVEEGDWRFIGPHRKPYWMTEALDAKEFAQRLTAKDAHAARMRQLRDNPRCRISPNGFRFECTDCGGMFEDDNEGIHADRDCRLPSARRIGWQ